MEWRRPDTGTARTGCFDSVPSTASARDETPLSMTRDFVTQPDKQGFFNAETRRKSGSFAERASLFLCETLIIPLRLRDKIQARGFTPTFRVAVRAVHRFIAGHTE